MIPLDRSHLAATHSAAVEQDEALRACDHELGRSPRGLGSVAEMVATLRAHGDYWERVQQGRLHRVKRLVARLMQPFFKPQVRYNLLIAEHLGRIEVELAELRREAEARP